MTVAARWRTIDVDAVTALVEHVAATVVAPRFRDLVAGEVREKSPGDLVTVVDTAAEAALVEGLAAIAPDVPVVGEEATSVDPGRLALLGEHRAFVVDPLDGTQAFVDGSPEHAVMVALVEDGDAVAGWICLPAQGATYVAEQGSGAFRNGERLRRPAPSPDVAALHGGVATFYLDDERRSAVTTAAAGRLGPQVVVGPKLWSGHEYALLATGRHDFAVYWRTHPWDHAAGAVLLREVGGVSRRFDGSDYRPGEPGVSLVAAADEATFRRVREALALG